MIRKEHLVIWLLLLTVGPAVGDVLPVLKHMETTTQLMIDGKPFLMLGVETTNKLLDDPSDLPHLDENLAMYKAADVNTVLIPITWKSLEPVEDEYDYTMIDALIEGCRNHDLRFVVLWFGAIKNGQVGYAPRWFVDDRERFFRAQKPDGTEGFCISPFCEAAIQADREAFVLLMNRIKKKDPHGDIVIMVQPENETGCAGLKNDRDYSPAAVEAWNGAVPSNLMDYLRTHDGQLAPWLQQGWNTNGKKTSGTWPEVFGDDLSGNHIFMSYYMARFVGRVAEAGREVHDLPMFANDWLGSLDKPGGPIGGPDFQAMDIWRCAAPALDAFAPDIYVPPFKKWCAAYHTRGNPLLIPEAGGRHFRSGVAAQCWYAVVQHDAMMFAPYLNIGDEFDPDHSQSAPYFKSSHIQFSYPMLNNMRQMILQKQGRQPREMAAFLVDRSDQPDETYEQSLKGLTLTARSLVDIPDAQRDEDMIPPFACVFWMGEGELLVVGTKMSITIGRQGQELAVQEATLGQYIRDHWELQGPVEVTNQGGEIELHLPLDKLQIEQIWLPLACSHHGWQQRINPPSMKTQ